MKDRQHGLNPQQIREFLAGWHPFCSRTDLFAGYGGFVTRNMGIFNPTKRRRAGSDRMAMQGLLGLLCVFRHRSIAFLYG